ncbi:MAG: DUF1569 domain-containing protein [Planctomycetaceae bacterium]|nr:DUF1569 domain-containing protein [Planctomycetaceae bacterium]
MTQSKTQRRPLLFTELDAAVAECHQLAESGYQQNGNWTLGQICRHLRLVQDPSIDGYPKWMSLFAPIRPFMRRLLLPRLLGSNSPQGIPTSSVFIPPNDLDDETELLSFTNSVRRFQNHAGDFKPHPGFGKLDRRLLEQVHAAHAAHHLGFLAPQT